MVTGFPPLPPVAPPPGRRKSETIVIWGVGSLAVLSVVVFVLGFVGYAWVYGNADHLGIFDDTAVTDTAYQSCRDLRTYVAEHPLPAHSSARETARAIRVQDQGIKTLIGSMRALGYDRLKGDHPALYWVADWSRLLRLREQYADQLSNGQTPTVAIPVVEGFPITHRMMTPVQCPVVKTLGSPLESGS